ncbi:MAG: hypothetical protein ABS75_23190 [Pelagibacterium sp. SCN 63-23]|nr:MAG: hypothetical protein ABS75_23190 [Pelagibacterium sp. SCN 63-23]
MSLTAQDLEPALVRWPDLNGARPHLVNHSENHTFRLDAPGVGTFMLRVHRPGYQSRSNIEAELAWLAALQRDTGLSIPDPISGIDGRPLQLFVTPGGETRHAVLFRFIAGEEPTLASDLEAIFGVLGGYAAQLHRHVVTWRRPAGFERQAWTDRTILDPDGLWGDWRVAPGVAGAVRPVLDKVDAELRRRLGEYGMASTNYGLIHADMRLGNLLIDSDMVSLIDFDDCGLCWFGYDFAAAISFHETHEKLPALKAAWVEAYQRERPLSARDVAALDSMVLLRRMALLAWIGSHAETALAQTHMKGFAEGTAALGERYLRRALW